MIAFDSLARRLFVKVVENRQFSTTRTLLLGTMRRLPHLGNQPEKPARHRLQGRHGHS
jgi:hypothetical protein